MSHFSKAAWTLLFITTLSLSLAAQSRPKKTPASEPPDASAKAEPASSDEFLSREQQRALWLLDQLFADAKGFRDASLKLRTQAQIADLRWPYDEARARQQFEEVFQAIAALKPERQNDDSASSPEFGPQFQLRSEALGLISQHDSAWARKLAESVGLAGQDAPDQTSLSRGDGRTQDLSAQPNPMSSVDSSAPTQAVKGSFNGAVKSPLAAKFLRPASTQDLLGQAETAQSSREKDSLYTRAVLQALKENDYAQARSITEKISDGPSRASFDSLARYRAALAALSQDDFAAVKRDAKDLPDLQQRAFLFDQMARRLQDKQDLAQAAEVLTEAAQSIGKADDGSDKARALLTIAGAAARFDSSRGFEVLQSAVEAINQVESDRRAQRPARETGFELNRFNFAASFAWLAHVDFDRALLLAQAIKQKEVSVQAQLALCRGVLTPSR